MTAPSHLWWLVVCLSYAAAVVAGATSWWLVSTRARRVGDLTPDQEWFQRRARDVADRSAAGDWRGTLKIARALAREAQNQLDDRL